MGKEGLLKDIKKRKKNGVLVYNMLNRLARYGVEITPYYWDKEFVKKYESPKIKGNPAEYSTTFIGEEEIRRICAEGKGYRLKDKLEQLASGRKCLALMHEEDIVAYSWIELNSITFRMEEIEFGPKESYLGGMHTIESYRGKNLAAYLRHKVYEILEAQGRTVIFSISDYYNKPAIRFKQKLKARHYSLRLYVNLFERFEWNWKIKQYTK